MVDYQLLSQLRGLIIDLDGVLWFGDRAMPGLVEFFAFLHRQDIRFVLATNAALVSVSGIQAKLRRFGVTTLESEQILTSGLAVADYIAQEIGPRARVFAVGEAGLFEALASRGLEGIEEGPVDAVVVGLDRAITFDRLARAMRLIRAGARYVGTNPDVTFPMTDGLVPGTGALLAFLTAATGVRPVIIGKPEPGLYRVAMERLGTPPERTAALGDRLATDILGGINAGIHTILVLSGVTTEEEVEQSVYKPDLVFADIDALRKAWAVLPSE